MELCLLVDYRKFYYKNKAKTVWHREDGPAAVWDNGRKKAWYFNGKRHRIDGPACEYANGRKEWYIEGKEYSEEEFINYIKGE